MKCFYHADMDGHCSGAIVRHETGNPDIDFIEINYHNDFPFGVINPGELVYIVDFSIQKEGEFDKLLEITNNVVWIDHHTTAIERHSHLSYLKGIREHDKPAACELVWKYFAGDTKKTPRAVKLLGDYDTWTFKYGDETKLFQAGIKLEKTHPKSPIWDGLFKDDGKVAQIIYQGDIAIKYRDNVSENLMRGFSYETVFEGHKGIVCNQGITGSHLFKSVEKKEYELMIPIVFDGSQWTVSVYSTTGIDCAEIAKKYGGGGHKGAAGFQCKVLPFTPKG